MTKPAIPDKAHQLKELFDLFVSDEDDTLESEEE